jgi:hypothetical protein
VQNNQMVGLMAENALASRTLRIIQVVPDKTLKVDINPELSKLYAQLAEATVASREAQRIANEKPSPGAEQKFWDLDLQLEAIISRINQILE